MIQIIKRNTFSILIFIHRGKKNKHEQHPIYCRLTIQGISKEFSTQLWIEDKKWNVDASKFIGWIFRRKWFFVTFGETH